MHSTFIYGDCWAFSRNADFHPQCPIFMPGGPSRWGLCFLSLYRLEAQIIIVPSEPDNSYDADHRPQDPVVFIFPAVIIILLYSIILHGSIALVCVAVARWTVRTILRQRSWGRKILVMILTGGILPMLFLLVVIIFVLEGITAKNIPIFFDTISYTLWNDTRLSSFPSLSTIYFIIF